jgi:hypothetical protein
MMSDAVAYGKYAQDVLSKQMDPKALDTIRAIEARGDFANPKYMELLMPNFYDKHFCRVVPNPVTLQRAMPHLNVELYTIMQGPSEFGVSGRLATWDRSKDLPKNKSSHPYHRRTTRYDGSRTYEMDGHPGTEWPQPDLPQWKPLFYVG